MIARVRQGWLAVGVCLAATLSCLPGRHGLPSATAIPPQDYLDLKNGSSLRILVPVYQAHRATDALPASAPPVPEPGNTLTLSAPNLLGYSIAVYRAQGTRDGRIRLRFDSAQTTIDAHTKTDCRSRRCRFPCRAASSSSACSTWFA